MIELEKIIDKYYKKDEPIIIACSTWPDSMFLVYELLKTKYSKNIVACYFNHKLREESDKEEKFLEDLWKKLWFKVEVAEAKIKEIRDKLYPNKWLEELAREKRYAFLNAILNIYQSDKLITGHHLDDRIETFLFNAARWSKLTWLINMKEKSWAIIRPLINTKKSEIIDYLDNYSLDYNIDETNFDTKITRNKIRHDIIPQFEQINSNYKNNFNNLIKYLEEIKDLIDNQVKDFLYEQWVEIFNSKKYKINTLEIYWYFYIDAFNKLEKLIQKEVIRHIFYISNNKSTIWLSESNINEVIKFINWKNNKTKKEIKDMKLKKENEIIIFE